MSGVAGGIGRWVTGAADVLGLNARNYLIQRHNSPKGIRLVNRKYETKQALAAAGVPVPETLGFISTRGELAAFDWSTLPDAWALKPNGGRQGTGILLAAGRGEDGWVGMSGKPITTTDIEDHIRHILEGELSLGSFVRDAALFEPLLRTHPEFAALTSQGLPDIRIICHHSKPVMAMARLPSKASGGKANLHQGAVGAAIDLDTGRVSRALLGDEDIERHPDTGEPLVGRFIPCWDGAVAAAVACCGPIGLSYYGADVVIDENRGPLILEVNARPGLQIQAVNRKGLTPRLSGHKPTLASRLVR